MRAAYAEVLQQQTGSLVMFCIAYQPVDIALLLCCCRLLHLTWWETVHAMRVEVCCGFSCMRLLAWCGRGHAAVTWPVPQALKG